jgi:hypothetical protein
VHLILLLEDKKILSFLKIYGTKVANAAGEAEASPAAQIIFLVLK